MDVGFSGRGWQALALAGAATLLLLRLGAVDLWAPDEPRYAQVSEEVREMARGVEGLVLLSLNGEVYDQKPPAYYWLAALAGAPGGRVTEGAARLPSALSGIALVALALGFGAMLLDRSAAFFGAGILLTSGLFCYLARRAQLDILLALFESLALLAFWRLDRGRGARRPNLVLMHASLGLAVLTKGPVGILLPALTMAAFLAWEGRLRALRSFFPLRALALSVLPGLLWIVLATALAPSGFFEDAVVQNLYGRFFRGTSKPNPWWYFFAVFPLNFLPWTALWPVVAWVGRRQVFAAGAASEPKRAWRFLVSWVGVTFVFFTLSTGKRDLYLIPCYPALALLCGDAAVRGLRALPALPRPVGIALGAFAGLLVAASVGLALVPVIRGVDVPLVFAGAMAASLAGAAALFRRAGGSPWGALGQLAVTLLAVFLVELSIFTLAFPAFEVEKSPRPIALAAAQLAPAGEPIGLVEQRPAVGGLAYYSGRRIHEIGAAENLRDYFRNGGHVAVVLETALRRVHGEDFSQVRARFRSGRRATLVVTPRGEAPVAGAPAAAEPERPAAATGVAAGDAP